MSDDGENICPGCGGVDKDMPFDVDKARLHVDRLRKLHKELAWVGVFNGFDDMKYDSLVQVKEVVANISMGLEWEIESYESETVDMK